MCPGGTCQTDTLRIVPTRHPALLPCEAEGAPTQVRGCPPRRGIRASWGRALGLETSQSAHL